MIGDITVHELDAPHHGNRWSWSLALDNNEIGHKIGGFASTRAAAIRAARHTQPLERTQVVAG